MSEEADGPPAGRSRAGNPADVMSPQDAAAVLGCSRSMIYKMCALKILPYFRQGVKRRAAIGLMRAAVLAYKSGGDPWAAVGLSPGQAETPEEPAEPAPAPYSASTQRNRYRAARDHARLVMWIDPAAFATAVVAGGLALSRPERDRYGWSEVCPAAGMDPNRRETSVVRVLEADRASLPNVLAGDFIVAGETHQAANRRFAVVRLVGPG